MKNIVNECKESVSFNGVSGGGMLLNLSSQKLR